MSTTIERGGAWRVLRHRNYRLLWLGQIISTCGTQIQFVATSWLVYQISNSPLQLGVMGLFRAIPVLTFSMIGGTLADTLDRRRLLLITQTILLVLSALLALTTALNLINVIIIYGFTILASSTNAFDNPARQALIPNLVPREELTSALTLNVTTFQLAQIIGPAIGGFIIALFGVAGAYTIDSLSFIAVIIALLLLRTRIVLPERANQQRGLAALVEGFVFVRRNNLIFSVMMLDFLATFFGTINALLPIYARDILKIGPEGYGALSSAISVGAVGASIVLSTRSRIRAQGPVLLTAVAIFGLFIVGFGLSHTFWLAFVMLAGSGASDTVSMILRGSILQLATPDELRGRTTAVHSSFAMGGPQLGNLRGGFVAELLGPAGAAVTGGLACIAVVGLIAAFVPKIRLYRL